MKKFRHFFVHFKKNQSDNQSGFTLLEVIIFSAIFAIVAVSFTAILISITGVSIRQTGSSTVNQESQFAMQTIQRYIQNSGLIDIKLPSTQTGDPPHLSFINLSATSSVLKLIMPSSTIEGGDGATSTVKIYASDGVIYLEGRSLTPERLTTDKVRVDKLEFIKRSNLPNGHDIVDVALTISYNTPDITRKFSQFLQTSISRASAASFDDNLVPNTDNSYSVGLEGTKWNSINGLIKFDTTGNVGIGSQPNIRYKLYVDGGDFGVNGSASGSSTIKGNLTVTPNSSQSSIVLRVNDGIVSLKGGLSIQSSTLPILVNPCTEAAAGYIKYSSVTKKLQACMPINNIWDWYNLMATSTNF